MRKFSPISCEKAQGALGHAKEAVHAFNRPPFATRMAHAKSKPGVHGPPDGYCPSHVLKLESH